MPRKRGRSGRWPFWSAVLVAVVGLAVTGVLTWAATASYNNNEKHLLTLRAKETSTAVAEVLPALQIPLASAAALADATDGNRTKFMRFVAPYVGTGRDFVSLSLWRVSPSVTGPIAVAGSPPQLPKEMPQLGGFFGRVARTSALVVSPLLRGPPRRLGYAFSGLGVGGPFAAYGESALPANPHVSAPGGGPFTDLAYAVYLGKRTTPSQLILATARRLPLPGRRATVTVPFGNTFITIQVSPRHPLAGSLPQRLPRGIGVLGVLLTLGAAALTARLIERRRHAERLAVQLDEVAQENRRLYTEQRGIAQTLQHALLPDVLPQLPGIQTSARYESGVEGVDVGGDWYDLIVLDERRLLLVVGDVSGRGLRAATTMAGLRYAIHAYAAQGDSPATILSKLSGLLSVRDTGQLATVLCAVIDVEGRLVTLASAGHLPPLLLAGGEGKLINSPTGLPIGVEPAPRYEPTTITVPAGATLLAFTDGLVERRGESIDAGLERLRSSAAMNGVPLDELLRLIVAHLRDDDSPDDTAIAGVRWLQ